MWKSIRSRSLNSWQRKFYIWKVEYQNVLKLCFFMNKKNVILCVNSHAASPIFSHIQIFTKINFVCKSGTRKWNNSARFYFMQKNPADEIAWAKCKFKKITHGLVAYFFCNNSTHVFFYSVTQNSRKLSIFCYAITNFDTAS